MMNSSNTVPALIKICLLSFQALLYIAASIFCIRKVVKSWQSNAQFIKYFYIAVIAYIVFQIALQTYQLVYLVKQFNSDEQLSTYEIIAINTFCIITDTYLIAMLSEYWKSIEMEFRKQALNSYEDVENSPHKCSAIFIPCHIWTILYISIYVYLNVSGISYSQLQKSLLKEFLLYYLSQGVTALLILLYIGVQTKRGMTLLKTLKKYQSLIAFEMNKGRFLLIFWMTSVVNVARIVFLLGIVLYYAQSDYQTNLWVEIYAFTLTAIFPISFYLFGFKVKDKSEEISSVLPQQSLERSANPRQSDSSHHQTELAESF